MELKIKALTLKEMVTRAVKGASCNKLLPITSLMAIELKKNVLTITTTDATNYLYIKQDKVEGDDFYVVVEVDKFSKLIARMTCETITLTLKDSSLEVKGNGTYNIALPLDEEGNVIKYPDPLVDVKLKGEGKQIHLSTIQTILNSIKPALAVTLEIPCYTGYYLGDTVMATDTYKISSMNTKLVDEPMLVSAETMNLLAVMTSENINLDVFDNVIVFTSPDCAVYSTKMEGLEDYNPEGIAKVLEMECPSNCKISKNALVQLLDRVLLFVSQYDKNSIHLTFTKEGLQISSKTENGVEIIPYMESKKFKEFTCDIDIAMFLSQVKAHATDVIELHYGSDKFVKMVDGNITHLIALFEEVEE